MQTTLPYHLNNLIFFCYDSANQIICKPDYLQATVQYQTQN